jgi:AraC-like DNA-binding protein
MQHTVEHCENEPVEALARSFAADAPDPIERVLGALEYALAHGEGANPLLIARTARRLGMSARTLQRRLRASGTSFTHLLQQLRERSACRLLRQDDRRLSEIAEQLGFSEHSAFSRAFKRWTGTSPGQFRCTCQPSERAH